MIVDLRTSRTRLVALVALLGLATGCHLLSPDAEGEIACATCRHAFEVHLNNGFDDDRVRVEIDGQTVFDERVTTDDVWSLAEVLKLQRPEGTHHIRAVVNGSEEGAASFELDRELFIHVRYYREALPSHGIPEGVVIEIREHRPVYD